MTIATLAPELDGSEAAPGSRVALGHRRHQDRHLAQPDRYTRIPEQLFFSSVQPIMFVAAVLLRLRRGHPHPGRRALRQLPDARHLRPDGVFGAVSTAIGLAEDLQKGLIERFRALPMARSAVLGGRTTADLCRNVGVVIVITVVGFAVGFRIAANVFVFVLGLLLVLLLRLRAQLGLRRHRALGAEQRDGPADGLPDPVPLRPSRPRPSCRWPPCPAWLQGFAANQPVSVVIDAARWLMLGGCLDGRTPIDAGRRSAGASPCWCVLVPLAVWRYRRTRLTRTGWLSEALGPALAARPPTRRWAPGPARSCRGRAR